MSSSTTSPFQCITTLRTAPVYFSTRNSANVSHVIELPRLFGLGDAGNRHELPLVDRPGCLVDGLR